MEVDLPSIGPPDIEHVERVRIEGSGVARGALTAQALAMLLCGNRYGSLDCSREARADL
jgi:hypothetical protein